MSTEIKPKIFAFVNGGSGDWWECSALTEDGMFIAGHICSHPSYGPHDMGVTSDWKHDTYSRYYPNGYEIIWVDDARTDVEVAAAYERHKALTEDEAKERLARLGPLGPAIPRVQVTVSESQV